MISETRFAKSYSSVWRGLTPTLELFVRKANLRLAERIWTPLNSTSSPARRALINQVAYGAVKAARSLTADFDSLLEWVRQPQNLRSCEIGLIGSEILTTSDIAEAAALAERMSRNLFTYQPHRIELAPAFQGCGIINSCFGDAMSSAGRIIELKDGDRPFRSYDFRQLVIYGALHMNAGNGIPSDFQVINSRRGLTLTVDIEVFAREVAGQSATDLLSEVVRVISDATITQE